MEVFLLKDNVEVSITTHLKYTVFDEYMLIFIKDIVKTDAGTFTIRLKNDSGDVSASFLVYITGTFNFGKVLSIKITFTFKMLLNAFEKDLLGNFQKLCSYCNLSVIY